MSNETLFFICGIALAVSAVLVSVVGLKAKDFPGKAFPVVILWFAILVGGATTFAVLHAQDEEQAKAAEDRAANKEAEEEDNDDLGAKAGEESGGGTSGDGGGEAAAKPEAAATKGPGGTLQLKADPSAIAYDTTSLESKSGKVTIDFTNPAPLEHDVAIESEDGEQLADSELIAEGKTSTSAELAPGTYTFYCTVPGHREAGMEGTLTVK
jgi:plastocyanin